MKNIETGHFDIFNIYKFIASHPRFPRGRGTLREYTSIVNNILKNVPKKAGWYIWGRFNSSGWFETMYLGKSGNGKTSSIYARLKEEICDERLAFWATVYGSEVASREFSKITGGKYDFGIPRTLRKSGVHFIIWCSVDSATEADIKKEEDVLIHAYRPAHNAQRRSYPQHTQYTDSIIRAIDSEIVKLAA